MGKPTSRQGLIHPFLSVLLIIVLVSVTCGEPSSSSQKTVQPLVDMEKDLLKLARTYLKDQKRKLAELEPFADSVREAMKLSELEEGVRYLGNPINCYLMIKRYTSGWKELPPRLDVDVASLNKVQRTIDEGQHFLPSQDNLLNAMKDVIKFVEEEGMSVGDIVEGKIAGKSFQKLSANDCLAMADLCEKSEHYDTMKSWLSEAERLLNDDTQVHRHGGNGTRAVFNERFSRFYRGSNDAVNALKYIEMALEYDSKNDQFLKIKEELMGGNLAVEMANNDVTKTEL